MASAHAELRVLLSAAVETSECRMQGSARGAGLDWVLRRGGTVAETKVGANEAEVAGVTGVAPTSSTRERPARGIKIFGEEYASITVDCDSSDGERELGERSREPMPRVNVGGQFVVAAANILDKGVAEADHPYGTDLFETAHRP
jgi:hypothetical protein